MSQKISIAYRLNNDDKMIKVNSRSAYETFLTKLSNCREEFVTCVNIAWAGPIDPPCVLLKPEELKVFLSVLSKNKTISEVTFTRLNYIYREQKNIFSTLKNKPLQKISVESADDQTAEELTKVLKSQKILKELKLVRLFGFEPQYKLFKTLIDKNLSSLDILINDISRDSMVHIGNVLKANRELQNFRFMRMCEFGGVSMEPLCNGLKGLPLLRKLYLAVNSNGLSFLGDVIPSLLSLEELILINPEQNHVEFSSYRYNLRPLFNGINKNNRLSRIGLSGFPIEPRDAKILSEFSGNLEFLSVTCTDDESLKALCSNNLRVKHLIISAHKKGGITYEGLQAVLNLPTLEKLSANVDIEPLKTLSPLIYSKLYSLMHAEKAQLTTSTQVTNVEVPTKPGADVDAVNNNRKTPQAFAKEMKMMKGAERKQEVEESEEGLEGMEVETASLNETYAEVTEEKIKLEQALQKIMQEQEKLEAFLRTLTSSKVDLKKQLETENQLAKLQQEHDRVMAEFYPKEAKRLAIESIQIHPNAKEFYETVYIRLENVFSGAKAAASEFVSTASHNDMWFNVAGKLLSSIPVIGNTLDSVIGGIGLGLDLLGRERLLNNLKAMANLGNMKELQKLIEECARQLTINYVEQINALHTREELTTLKQREHSSLWEGIKSSIKAAAQKVKSAAFKSREMSDVEQVAIFAVTQIVSALLDGDIEKNDTLVEQFLQAVTRAPNKTQAIRKLITDQLGFDKVVTRDQLEWQLSAIFHKPGIKTSDGDLYAGNNTEPDKYGYRLGTDKEAEVRKLIRQKKPAQEKKLPVEKKTAVSEVSSVKKEVIVERRAQSSTSLFTVSETSQRKKIEEPGIDYKRLYEESEKKRLQDKKEAEEQRKQDKEEAERARLKDKQENDEKFRKLEAKVVSTTENFNNDVDLGNQMLKKASFTTGRSTSSEPIEPHTLRKQMHEDRARIHDLEFLVAELIEQVNKLSVTAVPMPLSERKKKTQHIFSLKLDQAKTLDEVYALYNALKGRKFKFLCEESGFLFRTMSQYGLTDTWCNIVMDFKAKCIELLNCRTSLTSDEFKRYEEILSEKSNRIGRSDTYQVQFENLRSTLRFSEP